MLVLAGLSGVDHGTAVRKSTVGSLHLFFSDECDRGVIVGEVVRHLFDLFLDAGLVCAVLCDNIALTGMLLAGGQFRVGAGANRFQRSLYRNRILTGILDTFDSADRIRMSLGDASSPEGIVLAVRKHRVRIQTRDREHARIPSAGDHADLAGTGCSRVDSSKMSRNVGVCIKTVYNIEHRSILRRLDREISSAAATEHQHIDLVLH